VAFCFCLGCEVVYGCDLGSFQNKVGVAYGVVSYGVGVVYGLCVFVCIDHDQCGGELH